MRKRCQHSCWLHDMVSVLSLTMQKRCQHSCWLHNMVSVLSLTMRKRCQHSCWLHDRVSVLSLTMRKRCQLSCWLPSHRVNLVIDYVDTIMATRTSMENFEGLLLTLKEQSANIKYNVPGCVHRFNSNICIFENGGYLRLKFCLVIDHADKQISSFVTEYLCESKTVCKTVLPVHVWHR